MKTKVIVFAVLSLGCGMAVQARAGGPLLGSGFTFQGQLRENGLPVNGLVDLEFRLFYVDSGGTQVGGTQAYNAVSVVNGLFTAEPDFGAAVFDGNMLWLEVAVRNPAGSGDFSTLSPRQLITRTPYAQQAQTANRATAAFRLDAQDGSPTQAVFVNNAGNVGIGNTSPNFPLSLGSGLSHTKIALYETSPSNHYGMGVVAGQFSFHLNGIGAQYAFYDSFDVSRAILRIRGSDRATLDSDLEIGTGSGDYHHLRLGGGNSTGFLYGSYPGLGDGIHMGYNYYYDAAGTGRFIHSDGHTSRISTGYGYVGLAVGDPGAAPVDRLWIDSVGNVHISSMPFGDFHNVQWNSNNGGLYYDNSTRRHKENIKPFEVDFERLLDAEPVTYTRPGRPDRWEVGYIAEDMHELGLRELVSYDAQGLPDGYNYEKSTLYLVAIAKAQRDKLAAQEKTISELTNRLDALEAARTP